MDELRKTKRLMAWLLAIALLFGLVACGEGSGSTVGETSLPGSSPSEVEPEGTDEPEPMAPVYELPDANKINPLTGEKRPEGLHEDSRPVAIMVANNTAALPQRGVAAADVVYEMLTEGGITRLMAVYADLYTVPEVGPVRSARDGFVQLAVDYDAILVSIGASVYANNLIAALGYKTINGIYLGTTAFYFDSERHKAKANEYCWYTNAEKVFEGMNYLDVYTTGAVRSLFAFNSRAAKGGQSANLVEIVYSGVSTAGFEYDSGSGLYLKNHNGTPHADEDGTRLAFTNLLLLQCDTQLKVDGTSLDFALTQGAGYYFVEGTAQHITWEKDSPDGQLRVYAADGSQLELRPGKSYIGVLPADSLGLAFE